MFGIFYGLLGTIMWILFIAGIVCVIAKSRTNRNNGITAYQALMGYFYFVTGASIMTAVIGLIHVAAAVISRAFDGGEIANDASLGFTLITTGSIICALHICGRRVLERKLVQAASGLRRVYLFIMLGITSITGLIALPLAANDTINYLMEESRYRDDPSEQLAVTVVFLPLWAYYLFATIRELRGGNTRMEVDC
ncbi:MAG: hypothetical protein HOC20_10690 [Chloroflexi bacterium]|jgi:hypothetical protein|nr:hypothetical protein [Chloroflexota bacterium]